MTMIMATTATSEAVAPVAAAAAVALAYAPGRPPRLRKPQARRPGLGRTAAGAGRPHRHMLVGTAKGRLPGDSSRPGRSLPGHACEDPDSFADLSKIFRRRPRSTGSLCPARADASRPAHWHPAGDRNPR